MVQCTAISCFKTSTLHRAINIIILRPQGFETNNYRLTLKYFNIGRSLTTKGILAYKYGRFSLMLAGHGVEILLRYLIVINKSITYTTGLETLISVRKFTEV